jgi:hypothetical protein
MENWKAPSPEEILSSIRREKERILKRPMFGIEVGGKPPYTSNENPAILSGKAKGFGYNKPEAKVILVPKRNNDGNDSRI